MYEKATEQEVSDLRQALSEQLHAKEAVASQLGLHEIYETFWPEWERLSDRPLQRQIALKLAFLELCLEFTPTNLVIWDQATLMKLPYHVKHRRDLEEVERKIAQVPAAQALRELDAFMFAMRLKGKGLGVL
jgi:hypothetical protein